MTPQEEFDLMLVKSGVKEWHNKGHTGEGINILNCESNMTTHGRGTGNIIHKVAPDSFLFSGSTGIQTKGDELISAQIELDNGERYDLHHFVEANKIDIISASKSGINDSCKGWNAYCKKMQDETGVVIFNSAGNNYVGDGETLSTHFPHGVAFLVGALNVDMKRIAYSSVGQELDFMAFSGMIGGTSAASPFMAGMMALVMSKYGKLTPSESYKYLCDHSVDLGAIGSDTYNGKGMPILPDKTTIKLQIGSNIMTVDGIQKLIDQPPKIDPVSNRTLVPVRAIAEGFGATVQWDSVNKEITLEV